MMTRVTSPFRRGLAAPRAATSPDGGRQHLVRKSYDARSASWHLERSGTEGRLGLENYLLKDGRFYLARELDRGRPILWSSEQWVARYASFERKDNMDTLKRTAIAGFAVVALTLIGMAALVDSITAMLLRYIMMIVLTVMLGLASIYIGTRLGAHLKRSWPVRGLYTQGVQVSKNLFIPYWQLKDIQVQKTKVRLVPKRVPKDLPWNVEHPAFWTVPLEVLGEQGLMELRTTVLGTEGRGEPPRLVLYGLPGPER